MAVITKVYDLVIWSCNHIAKFPRSHRFSGALASRRLVRRRPAPAPLARKTMSATLARNCAEAGAHAKTRRREGRRSGIETQTARWRPVLVSSSTHEVTCGGPSRRRNRRSLRPQVKAGSSSSRLRVSCLSFRASLKRHPPRTGRIINRSVGTGRLRPAVLTEHFRRKVIVVILPLDIESRRVVQERFRP
jgi:hypothetical protein